MTSRVIWFGIVFSIFFVALIGCQDKAYKPEQKVVKGHSDLVAHTREFKKEIIPVMDHIHVAIGYGLANSIMIEGSDGLIIIDATESIQTGEEVLQDFRTISDKPVTAIIYTHNHTDHVFGAKAFAKESDPLVIAHSSMPHHLDKIATVIRPIIEQRSYRMFGNLLEKGEVVNCGIGAALNIDKETRLGVIRPTRVFQDSLDIEISGISMKLFHAPGETPDQIYVYLPEDDVLFCGDNLYKTFPNLYTIRGTSYRDVNSWKKSLDLIRRIRPSYLVPSHTRPIEGDTTIYKILTDYRDAIQFTHDQTVRYMNLGLTPNEIVERVQLPVHLAESPYLAEFYGKVEWTVRAIFDGYLGWFDGNPTSLHPFSNKEEAERMAQLAGGFSALVRAMEASAQAEDHQWTLELSDHILVLDDGHTLARRLRMNALIQLAESSSNPNARNYYLTVAREMDGLANERLVTPDEDMVHDIPMRSIFDGMATFLNADKAADVEQTMVFQFTDTGEAYSVIVRKGVAEIQPYAVDDADYTLTTESHIWKEIAAEIRKPLPNFVNGNVKVNGGKIAFLRFMDLFDR